MKREVSLESSMGIYTEEILLIYIITSPVAAVAMRQPSLWQVSR